MIVKATDVMTPEIKNIWKECFPEEDPRYIDYYFKNLYKPGNCFVNLVSNRIVSTLVKNIHPFIFNGKVLQTSMIVGVCTIPSQRGKGYMRELMDVVMDVCEHTELITLLQTTNPSLYEMYGFRTVYNRKEIFLERKDVKRITTFGCAYEPTPIDLLKVYSNFIKRFNGFYARDLEYFVNYKKEIIARGGKLVAYYNSKDQIMGYAAMFPEANELKVEELVYLDSTALVKLLNAALAERMNVHLHVSEAEELQKIFPEAKVRVYPSTMARLNDKALFSKLFAEHVESVEQLFAASRRPLNLNEFA
jgi:predicted acetyltransferase